MTVWEPPIREYDFLFNEVFNAIESIEGLGFEDFDADYLAMLTEAWGMHAKEVWLPINELGDKEGLKFEDGNISMPQEFKDAYRKGIDEGWLATACKP